MNTIKPKFFRTDSSVKSILITTKYWFDKVNGNSYNSNVIIVNFGLKNEFCISVKFTYGYGNYGEQVSLEVLQALNIISSPYDPLIRSKLMTVKHDNCLKRDVTSWGLSCSNALTVQDAKKIGKK